MKGIIIEKKKEGVFLNVSSDEITLDDIIELISEKDVEAPEISQIKLALEKKGEFIKIAEYYGKVSNICKMTLRISGDKMKAFFKIESSKGRKIPEIEDVIEYLEEKDIKKIISKKNIRKILKEENLDEEFIIAEGKEPEKGKDGYLELKFNENKKDNKPSIDIVGNVDFKNISLINTVEANTIIAEIVLPEKGENGYDVFGEEIEGEIGNNAKYKLGKNVKLLEGGELVYSTADGMPIWSKNKLFIEELLILSEVGMETGNIYFKGKVIIIKDVKSDYYVRAEDIITINGNVENAVIESDEKIIINGNCYGKEEDGKLISEKEINFNFAENFEIFSKGNINIKDGVINCNMFAYGKIKATIGNGKIIGGYTRAEGGIEALVLGSNAGVETIVAITGKFDDEEVLEEKIKEKNKDIEILENNVNILQKIKKLKPELYSNAKEELFNSQLKDQFVLKKAKQELEKELKELLKFHEGDFPRIKVQKTCYPGVVIKLKDKSMKVKDEIERVIFELKDEKVIFKRF